MHKTLLLRYLREDGRRIGIYIYILCVTSRTILVDSSVLYQEMIRGAQVMDRTSSSSSSSSSTLHYVSKWLLEERKEGRI